MFTGIVEGTGRVLRIEDRGQGKMLILRVPAHLTEVQLGDSINVNGACLTITGQREDVLEVDLSAETLQKTALGQLVEGREVNLERALRLSDRLGGHIVTGHVDGTGIITSKRQETDFVLLRVRIPQALTKYVVEKGSIGIDGVSLTVNRCTGDELEMMLIPYTLQKTTLMDKKAGDAVNVETDILGKYVEKVLTRGEPSSEGISLSFLKEHGFINEE